MAQVPPSCRLHYLQVTANNTVVTSCKYEIHRQYEEYDRNLSAKLDERENRHLRFLLNFRRLLQHWKVHNAVLCVYAHFKVLLSKKLFWWLMLLTLFSCTVQSVCLSLKYPKYFKVNICCMTRISGYFVYNDRSHPLSPHWECQYFHWLLKCWVRKPHQWNTTFFNNNPLRRHFNTNYANRRREPDHAFGTNHGWRPKYCLDEETRQLYLRQAFSARFRGLLSLSALETRRRDWEGAAVLSRRYEIMQENRCLPYVCVW